MADRSEGMEAICIFATVVALALVPNANANAGEDWHRSAVMTARLRSGLCMTGALEYVWKCAMKGIPVAVHLASSAVEAG